MVICLYLLIEPEERAFSNVKLDGIFFIWPIIVYNRQGLLFAWLWYGMAFYKKTAIEEYTEIVKTSPYWEHKF